MEINYQQLGDIKKEYGRWIAQNWDTLENSSPKKLGYLIEFCEFSNPSNLEELYEEYTSVPEYAQAFYAVVEEIIDKGNFGPIEGLHVAFIAVFYNTFQGYLAEEMLMHTLDRRYQLTVHKTPKDIDLKYAVDVVYKSTWPLDGTNEYEKGGIQLKSIHSRKNNNTNYISRNTKKNELFKKEYGINVEYWYYDSEYIPEDKSFNIVIISPEDLEPGGYYNPMPWDDKDNPLSNNTL